MPIYTKPMSLRDYFTQLISKVEASTEITNLGKDANGFFKPTRAVLLKNLNLLRDLHDKPRAKEMVKSAWGIVVADLPPEWLVLTDEQKNELQKILR